MNQDSRDILKIAWQSTRRELAAIFDEIPVDVSSVARALGFQVEHRDDIHEVAYLESRSDNEAHSFIINIQAGIPQYVEQFATAHEIGHAILLRDFPAHASSCSTRKREEFATAFALELLVPEKYRDECTRNFQAISSAREIFDLCGKLRVGPRVVLRMAKYYPGWTKASNRLWLLASYRVNSRSRQDPKIRIDHGIYDRDRYFVPTNKGLDSIGVEPKWLSGWTQAKWLDHHEARVRLDTCVGGRVRRYCAAEYLAKVTGVQLRNSPPYLLLIELQRRLDVATAQPHASDLEEV